MGGGFGCRVAWFVGLAGLLDSVVSGGLIPYNFYAFWFWYFWLVCWWAGLVI